VRILVASPYREVIGGAQTYLKTLFELLRARGHAVALLHELPVPPGRDVVDGRDSSDARFCVGEMGADAAQRAVGDWKPDVVYSQALDSLELEASLLRRYPCVLFAHDYYGTCVTGTKLHSRPVPHACERTLGPACLVLNYAAGCGGRHPVRLVRRYREVVTRGEHVRAYAKVLVASQHMAREFERHGVAQARLELLRLFAAIEPDAELAPAPVPSGMILFASRITRLKGGAFLVEALQRSAKALGRALTLVVVGEGAERAPLEAEVRNAGIPARFLGWQDTAAVSRLMRESELLAVPSLWPEPLGLVGIEAGGLGLPAVGFAHGGIPDWLRPGESGELAPADPPTASGLGDAIVRALRDRGHYERLREGAWRVARTYSREAHVVRLEEILGEAARA
jgi:glycosyltransferase involved in cell wall biosynthesis